MAAAASTCTSNTQTTVARDALAQAPTTGTVPHSQQLLRGSPPVQTPALSPQAHIFLAVASDEHVQLLVLAVVVLGVSSCTLLHAACSTSVTQPSCAGAGGTQQSSWVRTPATNGDLGVGL